MDIHDIYTTFSPLLSCSVGSSEAAAFQVVSHVTLGIGDHLILCIWAWVIATWIISAIWPDVPFLPWQQSRGWEQHQEKMAIVWMWWLTSSHLSHQHLIDEHPEAPPVDCPGVRCVCEHLWGQKLRSPTECAGPVSITHASEKKETKGDQRVRVESDWTKQKETEGQCDQHTMNTHLLYKAQSQLF